MDKPLSERTESELVDQLWNWLIPAWLGTSLGVSVAFGAVLWRALIYPPRLVIRYSDGVEVWSFGGEIIHGAKPETSEWATLIAIGLFASGIFVAMISSWFWWEANLELNRRKRALQAAR